VTGYLFEPLAGYPKIVRRAPLDKVLSKYCERKPTVEPFDGPAKAFEVWEYVVENFKFESIPPNSLPLAVVSQNRRLVEWLLSRGNAVTSEVLHSAFFIRDYNMLEFLLDHLQNSTHLHANVNVSNLSEPEQAFHLQLIAKTFAMPYPVQTSDHTFYRMLHRLIRLGVYDLNEWRRSVLHDFLTLEASITAGVVTDLIQIGGASVTADVVPYHFELGFEEFRFLFDQPIEKKEIAAMRYGSVKPDVAKAKVMRSVGVRVTVDTLRWIGFIGPYRPDQSIPDENEQKEHGHFFRTVLSWFVEDHGLMFGKCDGGVNHDARNLIYNLLRAYRDHMTGPATPFQEMVFKELLEAGFPVRQQHVEWAQEKGWTNLAELFRGFVQ
jgi:hypothetical protein